MLVMNFHPKRQHYVSLCLSLCLSLSHTLCCIVMWFTHRVLLLFVFLSAGLPVADKIVQRAIFNESGENKDEADRHEEVHGCHIGDLRQRLPGNGAQRGHGQHCGNA